MRAGIIGLGGESSKGLVDACKKYFENVDFLNIKDFEVHATNKGVNVNFEKKNLRKYDCLYVRGSYRYALLQRAITRALDHKVFMPIKREAFAIGHDKFLTLIELQRKGVEIPKTYYAATTALAKRILEKEVDYPVIMKVPRGTHGKGVMVADSLKSARTILDLLEGFKEPYIIQEFVETKGTSDIRAVVVDGKVVAAYQRRAAKDEVRTNIHSGGKRKKHKLTKEEEGLAVKSAHAIGAGICGVDILNAKVPSVIEINVSPSIKAPEEFTGIEISDEIAKYLFEETKKFKKGMKAKG